MYGYIYKTTNKITGKIYVGQKKSDRFLGEQYLGSGKILKSRIKYYGKENFSVEMLDTAETFDELNEKEIYWIDKLNARDLSVGYNIATGGSFGDTGYHLGMLGKHQSPKQRLAASRNGSYKRTDVWKHSKSTAMRGNNNGHGNKGREGTFTGRHHSEETKENLSKTLSPIVKEWHKNLSDEDRKLRGQHISNSKKGTICITDGVKNYYIRPEEWESYKDSYYKMSVSRYKKLNDK